MMTEEAIEDRTRQLKEISKDSNLKIVSEQIYSYKEFGAEYVKLLKIQLEKGDKP